MKTLEEICFDIINASSNAIDLYNQALEKAKEKKYEQAYKLVEEGEKALLIGHKVHADLLTMETRGQLSNPSLLLMHAEDQMMSTENYRNNVLEFIELYKIILKN